jgi:hypothetical protein
MSKKRTQRRDSPFNKEQEALVVLQYGQRRSIVAVRRDFKNQFPLVPWREVPGRQSFEVPEHKWSSQTSCSRGLYQEVQLGGHCRVSQYFLEDDTCSLRHAKRDLGLKMTTI